MSEDYQKSILDMWMLTGEIQSVFDGTWESTARKLLRAYGICYASFLRAAIKYNKGEFEGTADIALLPIAYMLAGFALENLFKACLIRKSPSAAKEKSFYTHNLVVLAKQIDLDINERTERFLEDLTNLTEWKGRYPVPPWHTDKGKAKWQLRPMDEPEGQISDARIPGKVGFEERKILTNLIKKIYEIYHSLEETDKELILE